MLRDRRDVGLKQCGRPPLIEQFESLLSEPCAAACIDGFNKSFVFGFIPQKSLECLQAVLDLSIIGHAGQDRIDIRLVLMISRAA